MKKLTTDKRNRFQLIWRAVTIMFLLFALCAASVCAWFCAYRIIGATIKISDPTSIFINAGNQEDIRYLNLADLDVETGTGSSDLYKDYVFCIRGSMNVNQYMLQLAYTTNNQFNYEIYRAAESSSDPGDGVFTCVSWVANTGDEPPADPGDRTSGTVYAGDTLYYYVNANASPLSGSFRNLVDNWSADDEYLAKTGADPYYLSTYAEGNITYTHHHKYAVPLYWQTNSAIIVTDADRLNVYDEFCQYFILRVKWDNATANKNNNKETDIIYISAKTS